MNTNSFWTDHWGIIAYLILATVYVVYRLGPWNWRFIPNRWVGVRIRLEKVVGELLGEGPVLILRPFERLVKVPLFDLKIQISLPGLPTAAPNPQDVHLFIVLVIKFVDPVKVILSVPDRDPVDEVKDFVRSAARTVVQMMTMDEIAARGALTELAKQIRQNLLNHPIFMRWGLEVVSFDVKDANYSESYRKAQNAAVEAEGDARATTIRAQAQKNAADLLGQASKQGLAAMLITQEQKAQVDTAKAGGIRTLVTLAGKTIDKFMQDVGL